MSISRLAIVLLLSAGSTVVVAQDFALQKYKDVLVFDGAITPQSSKNIMAAIDDVDLLLIRSGGGDGASGLAIAKALRDKNIAVVVNEYCLSACANYIFIGAPRKSLNPGAVLGFHGGLTGSPLPGVAPEDYPLIAAEDLATVRKQIAALYQEESDFYASIGFDPALISKSFDLTKVDKPHRYIELTIEDKRTVYQFDQAEEARQKMAALAATHASYTYRVENNRTSETRFYFPSLPTLRNAGVAGVQNYPYPANEQQLHAVEREVGHDLPGLSLVSDI